MGDISGKYELVVGLEVHAQLLTRSKLFCGDSTVFGQEPNTQVSPVSLAHPGTLPVMNKEAIAFAVKMGLACHCHIERYNYFARKNYFYADLPKGYQISQHTTPICVGGSVPIMGNGQTRNIRLNRIHLEEDAGKSLHDIDPRKTCIDLNRAGVPLIEIVTEPDIHSSDEAFAYLTEVRKLVRYLEICDGNMEEGSLRCDANISVRLKGETKLGTKVEVKNLNSIRNVKRAIEYEAERLMGMVERGETIIQQTRSFDANTGTTFAIRDKEEADDYRYFPDPDLTPFDLTDEFIEEIRSSIPPLAAERIQKYMEEYQLPVYDAGVLTEEKSFSDLFEKIIQHTSHYKAVANWMLGPVRNALNEKNAMPEDFPIPTKIMARLIDMVQDGKLSFSAASTRVFPALWQNPSVDPEKYTRENNLIQESDSDALDPIVEEVLLRHAEKVKEYKKGKKGLLSLFVGEVMKRSKGKADPKVVNEILLKKLSE